MLEGAALGVCIHFIGSSGMSKLLVGGARWAAPGTLRAVIQEYVH